MKRHSAYILMNRLRHTPEIHTYADGGIVGLIEWFGDIEVYFDPIDSWCIVLSSDGMEIPLLGFKELGIDSRLKKDRFVVSDADWENVTLNTVTVTDGKHN